MTSTFTETVRNGVDTAEDVSPPWTPSKPSRRSPPSGSGRTTNGSTGHTTAAPSRISTRPAARTPARTEPFELNAGEPEILLGTDTGPNPAEFLLHALAACVTTSLVFAAAARGVRLTSVESALEGDLDVRGAMGLDDNYRNGFREIRMTVTIAGDAPEDKLRTIVQRGTDRSVVVDSITNGVPIVVDVITI